MNDGFKSLDDETLLAMVTPEKDDDESYQDALIGKLAQEKILNSIDTKTGAPANVRASVSAAQKPNDKLETLKKYFSKQNDLILLKVHTLHLDHLLWEQASNGDMYPHLYSPLDTSTVVNEYELPLNEDGSHVLPEILKKYQFSRPR